MDVNRVSLVIVDSFVNTLKQQLSFFMTEESLINLLNTTDSQGESLLYKLENEANSQVFEIRENILRFKENEEESVFTSDSKMKLNTFIKLPNMYVVPEFQEWFVSEVQSRMKGKVNEIINTLLESPEATSLITVCS